MPRTIQPELLDTLPPQNPDALHSRRDLRIINRFMGNYRWLEKAVRTHVRIGQRILEIGAGTGDLAERLQKCGYRVDGLDLQPSPLNWPQSAAWHSSDLRRFAGYGEYEVIVGNLIFHHLDDDELAELGSILRQRVRVIVASEPARHRLWQALIRTLGPLFGASHVTLHDARVSIAGGFSGNELPRALGLTSNDWRIRRSIGVLGGYRMIATRRA